MSVTMMGFESNKRIVKVMCNQHVKAMFGDVVYNFRSKLEYRWALYLQFLKEHGEIQQWEYEPKSPFDFQGRGYTKGPFTYLPDFKVIENDGTVVYQETKGHHDGDTNSKLRRMAECFPETIFELVLQRIPKGSKGAGKRRIAAKYTRRIIDASVIFRQTKGLINYASHI